VWPEPTRQRRGNGTPGGVNTQAWARGGGTIFVLIVSLVLLLTGSGRVALRKSLHKTEYAVKSNGSDEHD
jgi:hypothetical protein